MSAAVATAVAPRRDWRGIAFRMVAVLVTLFAVVVMGGLFGIVSPWAGPGGEPEAAHPEIHRWHSAQWAALTVILLGGSLLASLRRPQEKPVLAAFAALALVLLFLINTLAQGFAPELLLLLVFAGLLVATFPAPRALRALAPGRGWSLPLLALTLAVALLLAPNAWQTLQLQLTSGDEHAQLGHWMGNGLLYGWIIAAGLLAATRRGGWRSLATVVGVALLYLGVAAISIPNHDGSWGVLGGALSAAGGLAFIGATRREAGAARMAEPQLA